jgi:RND family efflux transporter MFP subunit
MTPFRAIVLAATFAVASPLAGIAAAAGNVVAAGVVRSDDKVELKSKQAVPIARIVVQEGASVKKGDLLIEMSNNLQRAQVEAARADVARAEAAVAEAEVMAKSTAREYERNKSVKDLITEKELSVSKDTMERAVATLETKRQDLLHARAELGVAQANLDETLLRAPADGTVSRIYLRVGATPKGQDQTLLDFLSLDRLYVEVAVPLAHLRSIEPGMPAKVVVEDENKTVKTSVPGIVRYVYPEIDTALRMFRVKVEVPPQRQVLPGMLAKVTIDLASRTRNSRSPR